MMPWCDHWLMQYEKNCVTMRLWTEHPAASAWILISVIAALAVFAFWRWRAV